MVPDGSGGDKYRVLVIDDDLPSLKVVEKYLSQYGRIEFYGVSSPNEALKWAKSNSFDIVITDYKMPEMNGIDLINKLKEISPDALYLLMTAYAELDTAIEAVRSGLFDFLTKPFTHNDFEIAIKRVISNLELKNEITHLRDLLDKQSGERELIGGSEKMRAVREKLTIFAQSDAPTLITGETGVGKELAQECYMIWDGTVRSPSSR